MKTNDISGRVQVGEVGFTIEFGRPGVGVWFRDIQTMCWALAEAGVSFEKKNPITSLMSNVPTGAIREDIMNEKLMSAVRWSTCYRLDLLECGPSLLLSGSDARPACTAHPALLPDRHNGLRGGRA